jgi:hypothetical protein
MGESPYDRLLSGAPLDPDVRQKLKAYLELLQAGGVDLEPPPELDLAEVSQEDLESYEQERKRRVKCLIELLYFAAGRVAIDRIAAQGATSEEVTEQTNQLRLQLISALFRLNAWSEVWVTLLDQEAPGPDPSVAEIQAILAGSAAIDSDNEPNVRALERSAALTDFLVLNGYAVRSTDLAIVAAIDLAAMLSAAAGGSLEEARATALSRLRSMEDPSHPALLRVVEEVILPRWFKSL